MVSRHRTMERRRALISSTEGDLREHRAAVIDACLRVGVEPFGMDTFSTDERTTRALWNAIVEDADIYIGILGFRYGFVCPGETKSFTEIEYERAVARGIPRLLFLMSADHPVRPKDVETGPGAEKLRQFKDLVRRDSIVTEFRSPDELKVAVVTGLVEVLRHESRSREPTKALLLLPYGDGHTKLQRFLSRELEQEGVQALSLDEMLFTPGAVWANAIDEAIRGADLVVVDVTSANPNVMYELGYVHALRKPTIIISEASALQVIPSDLASFQLLTYDKNDLEPLRRPLRSLLREYSKEGRR